MVEAPSSNLGTSTPLLWIEVDLVDSAAKTIESHADSVFDSARPPRIRISGAN